MALLRELIQPAQLERCGDRSFPVLSMTMHDGIMLQSDRFKKSLASVDQSAYKVVRRNQLVVGFPIDEDVLYIQQVVDAGIMSPAYDVWNVDETKVDLRYFELCLHSPQSMMFYKTNLRGTTARRRSLPKETLLSLPVPVPSMERQREIASALDRLQALIRLRQHQLCALDQLIKARFVEMFGTEQEADRWPSCVVADVADVTVGVVIQPTQYYCDYGVPAFRSLNVREMAVNDNDWVYFTEEGQAKNQKSIIRENDVLVVRSDAPGVACVATAKYAGYNAVDIIIAHPCTKKVNPVFLAMFTNMPHGMNQIRAKTGGAAQQHYNVGGYKALKLILPPIDLQNEFAAFVSQVDKSKLSIQASLDQLETLKQSLMQKYFG